MIPLQTASGHPVTHVVFSPDGTTVAVAQPHYGVTLLERATGRTVGVCALPRRCAFSGLTFCGGGRYLAAASPKGVEVFDAATTAPVASVLRGFYKSVRLADRDGALISGGYFAGVRPVWRPDGTAGTAPDPAAANVGGVEALSPDGRFALLTGAGGHALLFDLTAGRSVATAAREVERGQLAPAMRFCPLGRRFAINHGRTLDVYDACELEDEGEDQYADIPLVRRANGTNQATAVAPMPHVLLEPVFTLRPDQPGAPDWYPPFALLADGRGLLVKRPRNRVQLWDAPTGALVNEWSWRLEWVTCVAASADGLTAVAGGRFGRVLVWDLD